jgi:hypothetical protein
LTDFASVQKHLTAITIAQTDFAKSSFEASKAYFEKLAGVNSPDKFVELTKRRSAPKRRSLQAVYFKLLAEVSA